MLYYWGISIQQKHSVLKLECIALDFLVQGCIFQELVLCHYDTFVYSHEFFSCKNKLSSIPGLCYTHRANVLLNPCSLNPLNAKLNPFCHLLALLIAHHIFHVSGVRVKLLVLSYICTQFFGFRKLHIFPLHCSFCYSLCPLNYFQFL